MMEPTKPPPPPITNFPFQVSGNNNSKRVSVPMIPAILQWGANCVSLVTDVIFTSGSIGNEVRSQAGLADVLVTANFADSLSASISIWSELQPDRVTIDTASDKYIQAFIDVMMSTLMIRCEIALLYSDAVEK